MKDRTGRVIIDPQLNIVTADDRFFTLVGEGNYKSLLNCMEPEGIIALRQSLESITDFHTEKADCYRLRTTDGPFWFLIRAHLDRIDDSGAEAPLYSLEYIDMENMQERVASLLRIIRESNACLELCNRQMFRYDRQADDLHIFTGNMVHQMSLFRGTPDDWARDIRDMLELPDESSDELSALCEDFRTASGAFEHTISGSQKTDGDEPVCLRYLGSCVLDDNGNTTVVGIISSFSVSGAEENLPVVAEGNWDSLTGMYNKAAILKYAEQVISHHPEHPVHIGILDLDNYKNVNDTYGHKTGDEALKQVAGIIREALAGVGVAGRFGGDEILLVIERADTMLELRAILRTIRSNIEYVFRNTGNNYGITCSIGIATLGTGGDTFEELFAMADKMLYGAKRKGKNRYIIYTPELHADKLDSEVFTPGKVVRSTGNDLAALVNQVTEYLLGKRHVAIADCLNGVGEPFGIDEIALFSDRQTDAEYRWTSGCEAIPSIPDLNCLAIDGITQWLARSNPLVIDHREDIEHVYPCTWKMLQDAGIQSAMVFSILPEGRHGYLIFARKAMTSRKWPDMSKAYLMFISNAVGLRLAQDK